MALIFGRRAQIRYIFAGYYRKGQAGHGTDTDCHEKLEALRQYLEKGWLELTNIVRVILPTSRKNSENLIYQVLKNDYSLSALKIRFVYARLIRG